MNTSPFLDLIGVILAFGCGGVIIGEGIIQSFFGQLSTRQIIRRFAFFECLILSAIVFKLASLFVDR